MRLAYLTGTYPARSETFLAREIDGLRRSGVEVRLVALEAGDPPADDCRYRPALPPAELWMSFLAAGLRQGRELRPLGASLRNLPFAVELAAWCRAEAIDLLHAAWCGVPAQVAWMAHRLGGPPYTIAGYAADLFGPALASPRAVAEASGRCACNRAAQREMERRAGGRAVEYLPHGLPLAEWPAREREPSGPPPVLAVGRLVSKKGFADLIEASAGLPFGLVILGDGPLRRDLERQATASGVVLELPGWVGGTAVREWLERATVLVLPSRRDRTGDRDGLANVLLEAMATGVPVITTTAGSAGDAIVHGRHGLLVPPGDPPALRGAMKWLLGDACLRRRLAAAAREVVARRFDRDRNVARMVRWLTACLRASAEERP